MSSLGLFLISCDSDDDIDANPALIIPSEYISANYAANVTAENTVINELSTMTAEVNAAEANAQSGTVSDIVYPTTLSSVTLPAYRTLVEGWLTEIVKAANSSTAFINPGDGTPANDEEGGLLGSRLLDENGLELEQMVEKGSFGAALYNHALTVINGDLNSASIDKLVEIFGADPTFNSSNTKAAAVYASRRSFHATEEGYFYDMKLNLITAKAAIEAGDAFNSQRDQALDAFKLNWEKSNFATVIFYCNATAVMLREAGGDPDALGSALHAYAEGVGFTHGFRGISDKQITDAQIDSILSLLLAPAGSTPESYKFLNDATLLDNLTTVIEEIQAIYGFTDAEVGSFYSNNPT
ncbi:MAG: hypothetical protein RLO09_15345 [Cyclobacteriaceae bacterium]